MSKSRESILVTGGAGYIGSHIVEQLIKYNKTVVIVDNLKTGYKKLINKKAIFIKADIKNKPIINRIIKNYNISSVIHLAAYLNVSESEKYKKKYFQNNITGTKNLLEACKNTSVNSIIFSSSCSVYGNVKGSVNEDKKLKPLAYYGYTKYKGEELIKKLSLKFKYKYGILRYFNVGGASKTGKIGEIEKSHGHLIKNLAIQSLKKNPKVKIFGNDYKTKDGTCIRDYIHVSDLADIHIKGLSYLKSNQKSFVLNCGYGKGYSVQQIIDIFKKIKKNVQVNYQGRRKGDIAQVYANTRKLKNILKWKPKFNDIKVIVKSSIKWEKKLNYQY